MRSVLVTGGAGFIGSHVCEALLARGDRVVAFDSFDSFYDPARKERNVEGARQNPRYRLVREDIRDAKALETLFAEEAFDAVVHLAALAGVRPSIRDPAAYEEVNGLGTVRVLERLRKRPIPFVFGSSSSVYGARDRVPFREDDACATPASPYAATKRAGELLAYTYHRLFGVPTACLRFFTVYGPRQRPEMAIHKFARLVEEGEPVPMFGDGSTRRDYTFVEDIVSGTLAALDRCGGYEIYNLGGSRMVTLADLIGRIGEALGKRPRIERRPEEPGDVPVTCADVTKAGERLGYAPSVPIEEGLARFVAWFRMDRRDREGGGA
ncbi:MAG TPA: GDP-mannose 4,6-dehydratase [Planctomycetota bacterium]|jgi:UDP-glucuronate 4-epimerase|nr:GDP-mannose 4,6-dehydratase [Planctomycetota bacterium]